MGTKCCPGGCRWARVGTRESKRKEVPDRKDGASCSGMFT